MTCQPVTVLYGIGQLTVGGAERQLYELVTHVDRVRFRPIVFSISSGGAYATLLRAANIPLFEFPRAFANDPRPIWQIAQQLRREQVQILHTFGYYANLFGRLATLLYRPPIIITSERAIKGETTALDRPHYAALESFLTRRTDCVIANAAAVKHVAMREKRIGADNVVVIRNGVEIAQRTAYLSTARQAALRQQFALPTIGKQIGIVARLDPIKDHATFLHAAALVHAAHPASTFLIIGDGPSRQTLIELCHTLGIEQAVVFTGTQTGAVLSNLVALLDVVVLSSVAEGCSNAILEAMALGKPIVATNVGGNPELVVDRATGYLVPPQQPGPMADAIGRLLHDDALRRDMGRAARQRVTEQFSIGQLVAQTEEVYARLIGPRAST